MKFTVTATVALLSSVSAFAADLPSKKYANVAPVAAVSSWTGVYGGLNAGYAFGEKGKSTNIDGTNPQSNSGLNGAVAGGQLGVDYQLDSIVLGVAGDYDKAWASKNYPSTNVPGANLKASSSYVATVRGRIGYAYNNQLLAYATAGAAFSDIKGVWTDPNNPSLSQSAGWKGYVLGAGLEYKYTANISSFAEYRYYDYASTNLTVLDSKVKSNNSEIRTGVNYRF